MYNNKYDILYNINLQHNNLYHIHLRISFKIMHNHLNIYGKIINLHISRILIYMDDIHYHLNL